MSRLIRGYQVTMKLTLAKRPTWVKDAAQYPLAFAQVREDPLLDEWAIDAINKSDMNLLMIASGGCTAAYLATKNNIQTIDLVDINPAQLALTKYKLHLLVNYDTADRLTHYKLHEALDIKHADDFFDIVESGWCDEKKQYLIKQGLELGAYAFDRLYRDLIEFKVD